MNIYHLTEDFKFHYSIVAILSGIVAIGFLGFLIIEGNPCMALVLMIVVIGNIFMNIMILEEEYIVVHEDRIEYHRHGAMFECAWAGIEKIARRWYGWQRPECLILDKSRLHIKDMDFHGTMYPVNLLDLQETFIPVSCFSSYWRESEIGKLVKQHAPHLFID